MQKIWVCGANGQIGRAIVDIVDTMEFELLATDIDELNVTETDRVISFVEVNRPEIIINCSGITDIKLCEENPALAFKVNALGARNLSIAARKLEAKMVQISTDDVFDGKSASPYNEFDAANPVTVYGRSKLAGENYVKEFTYKHFIVRSTWIYGEGDNFVLDFLKKVNTKEKLSIASDQFGSPTSAKELARFLVHLVHTGEYGTYHATNKGVCSRYAFAEEILRLTGKKADMQPVPTAMSDLSNVRPAFAVLENFVMSMIDIYDFPPWQESLREYLEERGVLVGK